MQPESQTFILSQYVIRKIHTNTHTGTHQMYCISNLYQIYSLDNNI